VSRSIRVRAPATSANLGSGFDCLGLALDLWNEVLAIPGSPGDPHNLISKAAHAVYASVGARCPGFEFRSTNDIPLGRGLGSSAAAISCGVLLANHCLGAPLSDADILDIACRLEGHPDNVVPCLRGGLQVATSDERGHITHLQVPVRLPLQAVVFVPEQPSLTSEARRLLPSSVPLEDAQFNVARSALLVAALATGRPDLIAEATRDRLHQAYRLPTFPAGATLLEVAMDAGALGACMSGAGPSVLALAGNDAQAQAVADAFGALALGGTTLRLALSERGAHVVIGQ
jgi:homoserine kinase